MHTGMLTYSDACTRTHARMHGRTHTSTLFRIGLHIFYALAYMAAAVFPKAAAANKNEEEERLLSEKDEKED